MHALCGGFGQAVGQGLYQQLPVGIVAAGSFRLSLHGGGKDTYRVCDARRAGAYKVAQAEVGAVVGMGCLLAQQGEGDVVQQQVVAIGIGAAQAEEALHLQHPFQAGEHALGLLEELHGFGRLVAVGLGERRQPQGTARVAAVQVGDGGKARLEAPRVEEVDPVDVGGRIGDVVGKEHVRFLLYDVVNIYDCCRAGFSERGFHRP